MVTTTVSMARASVSPYLVNPGDVAHWDALVERLPGANFFHTAGWAATLEEAYGYKPFYFAMPDSCGGIRSLLPVLEVRSRLTGSRGVSLPFTDHCSVGGGDDSDFARLIRAAVALGKQARWRYLELRGGHSMLAEVPVSANYVGHVLDLGSAVASGYSESNRRAIRKSMQFGLSVRRSSDSEALRDYYSLHCQTRRRHGLPPQPFRFFAALQRHVLSKGNGIIVIVRYQDRPVSGAVFLFSQGSAIFKYGASDRRYLNLRPNNFLFSDTIRWLTENGFNQLNFGRTAPEQTGLRQFKRSWGAREFPISYYRFNIRSNRFDERPQSFEDHWYGPLFRVCPPRLCRFLGAILYRHVG